MTVSLDFNQFLFHFIRQHRFDSVSNLYEPISNGRENHAFISKSYDATSHFETCANDVLDLYQRITDERLDMNISADINEDDM